MTFTTRTDMLGTFRELKEYHLMSKSTRNSGKPWTPVETKALKTLAAGNTPTRVIGLKLGRSETAVYSKSSEVGVSLRPTNQAPYNRKK